MRRAAVALAMLLGVLVVALLGRGGSTLAPDAAFAQAAAKAREAGSFRVEITSKGGPIERKGTGVVDYRGRRVELTYEETYDLGSNWPKGGWKVIRDRNVLYTAFPMLAGAPGSKPWVRTDLADDDDLDSLVGVRPGLGDPARALDVVAATSGSIDRVGRARVRGTETTIYRAVVDLELLVAQATGSSREALAFELQLRREEGMQTTWTVDVWVDDQGMARRIRTEEQSGETPEFLTIEYFDFGVPVQITPPPPHEVMTVEELTDLMTQIADCGEEEDADDHPDDGSIRICVISGGNASEPVE